MKSKTRLQNFQRKNQKGVLTIDFIFSFLMVFGLFQLFYVLTYTLMVAHLTQYITFASARMYFAGHISTQAQESLARTKFENLTQNTPISAFFRRDFAVSDFQAREFNEFSVPAPERQKFVGVKVNFISRVLDFNVPLLGRTSSELQGQSFSADIGSYLYREPTSVECFRFMEDRPAAILNLNGKYNRASSHGFDPNNVGVFADNGC